MEILIWLYSVAVVNDGTININVQVSWWYTELGFNANTLELDSQVYGGSIFTFWWGSILVFIVTRLVYFPTNTPYMISFLCILTIVCHLFFF